MSKIRFVHSFQVKSITNLTINLKCKQIETSSEQFKTHVGFVAFIPFKSVNLR